MTSTTKVKVEKVSFLVEKSYNKTVIDFNFGRYEDLSTLKSNTHRHVYLIEVNKCKIIPSHQGNNCVSFEKNNNNRCYFTESHKAGHKCSLIMRQL